MAHSDRPRTNRRAALIGIAIGSSPVIAYSVHRTGYAWAHLFEFRAFSLVSIALLAVGLTAVALMPRWLPPTLAYLAGAAVGVAILVLIGVRLGAGDFKVWTYLVAPHATALVVGSLLALGADRLLRAPA